MRVLRIERNETGNVDSLDIYSIFDLSTHLNQQISSLKRRSEKVSLSEPKKGAGRIIRYDGCSFEYIPLAEDVRLCAELLPEAMLTDSTVGYSLVETTRRATHIR